MTIEEKIKNSHLGFKDDFLISLSICGIMGLSEGLSGLFVGLFVGLLVVTIAHLIIPKSLPTIIRIDNRITKSINNDYKAYGSIIGFFVGLLSSIVFVLYNPAAYSGIFLGPIIGFRIGSRILNQKNEEVTSTHNNGLNNTKGESRSGNLVRHPKKKINDNDAHVVPIPQSRNQIKGIDRILKGEEIISSVSGSINKELFRTDNEVHGSVNLTPTRIVCYSKKLLGGYHSRDFNISDFSSISINSGIFQDGIILHMNSDDISIGNISKKDSEIFVGNVKYHLDTIENGPLNAIDVTSEISISRETEFYQGFIRFKMSITNTSSFVANNVSLDFDYDDKILRIDRYEPDYRNKNGKIVLGNIDGNTSKSIAVYFDPMICSKGTDINCLINYKDAKGKIQTTSMNPKNISVICPILKTDSDINIGRLKEFVKNLPHRDSRVYQLQSGFDFEII
ncbi:MAG: PH domain-containing protein, partial [Thermodesulfobacteriota bacterium]|nr:PH domain-containing protein [Thermodesulfobacteriota bacterium]